MTDDQRTTAQQYYRQLLANFDLDITSEGLADTPRRHVKLLEEFTNPVEFNFTTFDAEGYDQMIVQTNIPFYSLCEHHVVPFFGHAAVAYIPSKRIVGLSKLARSVDFFARRLQNQERLTKEIAAFLDAKLEPLGVAVSMRARHLCQEMRGVKKPDMFTTTTDLRGVFREGKCRNEFLQHIRS